MTKLGYKVGLVDGNIDEDTIQAIREFQSDSGLTTDGKAGEVTVSQMSITLQR